MTNFFEFIRKLDEKVKKGENIDIDNKTMEMWKNKIIESEALRVQAIKLIRQ